MQEKPLSCAVLGMGMVAVLGQMTGKVANEGVWGQKHLHHNRAVHSVCPHTLQLQPETL